MKRKLVDDGSSLEVETHKKAALDSEGVAAKHSLSSKKNTSLYRPPTSDEINALKETENLFKSSLFRMQITELLSEVQPKKPRSKALDAVLHELNTFLASLPKGKEHELSDQSWLKKVKFPLPSPPSEVKGKFHFIKPSALDVVGSYMLGTMTKPDCCVDVAMEMPQECFQPKDYLNMRYHHKRALYLSVVASKLTKSAMFASVKFTHFNGELLKPILLLKPKGKAGKNYSIKLYPVLPKGVFKLQRFHPDMNNVRPHWFKGQESTEDEGDIRQATPHYNTSIVSDLLMGSHLRHIYQCITDCPSMKDAVVLINVWLQQRELSKGQGAFGSFLVAMVVSHLFSNRSINAHMSSYQILRIFLQFIGSTDWTETGIKMKNDQDDIEKLPQLSDFHLAFDVVLVDPSGYLNLCANMSKNMYFRVRHEAKLAMDFLNDRFLDGFEVLFMKKVPFLQAFDQFFCLSPISYLKDVSEKVELQASVLSRAGDWVPAVFDWMIELLKKGLGKRVDLVFVKPWTPKEWSVKDAPPLLPCDSMTVGLKLDADNSESVLDTGPAADDPKAGEFRAFWGGKSELRRFQDGTILEAVVWPCSNKAEKRIICERVIKHLLLRHCKLDPSTVYFIASQLDALLQPSTPKNSGPSTPKSPGSTDNVVGTGEEEMQLVTKAYEALCKQIRALELPLAVHSLQGISPIFRGAEVYPPSPCYKNSNLRKQVQEEGKENGKTAVLATQICLPQMTKAPVWCPVAEVLLQFETSGKWPDNLMAIQHIKAAFHIQLAELLSSKCSLQTVAAPKHVDVMKNGFGFRVKIAHYREMVLLQQSSPEEAMEQKVLKKQLVQMEKEIVNLPVLTTTLHSVQQQYSAYSGTVRLAKRWVSAHLLSNHFPSECLELLVASMFLSPAPFQPPSSPLVGFLRFLNLLATCEWQAIPIIVNLNNDLTVEDCQEISSKFTSVRPQLPALFIATPKDKFDSKWTKQTPTKQILYRLAILAKESYSVLQEQLEGLQFQEKDFKQIFRPPLTDYDVVIWLHHHCLPRYQQSVDAVKSTSTKSKQHGSGLPVLDFDPVKCFVTELQECFSDVAMFFHDSLGGDFIAVVWKTQALDKHQFKVLNAQYKSPVTTPLKKSKDQQNLVSSNISAIIEDFEILGKGLVKKVEVVKEIVTNGHIVNHNNIK